MRIDEVIKYLKINTYNDFNYKILSIDESKKLVFYIDYLEKKLQEYDRRESNGR